MGSDRDRWNRRWSEWATDHGQVEPRRPDALVVHPELLASVPTAGRALDLACGVGSQSLWLAARGFDVVALDVSPIAIDVLQQAADRLGHDIDARVHDTTSGLPTDLEGLAVIVCQRYRAPEMYPALPALLRSGGVLILTVLSDVGGGGAPGRLRATAGELSRAFDRPADRRLDVLLDVEGGGEATVIVRRR